MALQLEDVLQGDSESVGPRTPFEVTDFGSANWAATKALEQTTEIARLEAQAREWHAKIDDWYALAVKQYQASMARMQDYIRPWAERELQDKQRRSIQLPGAVVGFRKSPDRIDFTDEAAALEWAKENCPAAVKVVESVQKTPVKDYIKEHGELPPGVEYVEGHETFYVKPVE